MTQKDNASYGSLPPTITVLCQWLSPIRIQPSLALQRMLQRMLQCMLQCVCVCVYSTHTAVAVCCRSTHQDIPHSRSGLLVYCTLCCSVCCSVCARFAYCCSCNVCCRGTCKNLNQSQSGLFVRCASCCSVSVSVLVRVLLLLAACVAPKK